MKTSLLIPLVAAIIAFPGAYHGCAQISEDGLTPSSEQKLPPSGASNADAGTDPSNTASKDRALDQSSEQISQPQYAPSLDGSGVISMTSGRRFHALMGGAVSGGYDSNPDNLGTSKGSAVYSYSPYLGVQTNTSRIEYLFQYHPTFTRYNNYANQSMHVGSVAITERLTQRLDWALRLTGSHGDDSVRLLSPGQPVIIGGVPTTGSSAGSYLANAGLVTNFDGAFDLHYGVSPRDSISFRGGNSYLAYPALHDTGKVATSEFVYERSLRPHLGFDGYGQTAKYYGDLKCATFGGGVGIRWQPRVDTLISLRGGPQFDTPGCKSQQGFAYSASFTTKVVARAQFFLTANRVAVAGFLGAGLWQDDITGGYERQLDAHSVISFNAGYVHSSTLLNISSYGGTFFDSSYLRTLRKGLSLACSYRSFNGSSGGTPVNRNMVFVSLTLTPNTRSLSQ
jgi:hypothetical protein